MQSDRPCTPNGRARYELRHRGIFDPGCGFSLPCDAQDCVDLDRLGERAGSNHLIARAALGIELAAPVVLAVQ